jgi:hypothetical protein
LRCHDGNIMKAARSAEVDRLVDIQIAQPSFRVGKGALFARRANVRSRVARMSQRGAPKARPDGDMRVYPRISPRARLEPRPEQD